MPKIVYVGSDGVENAIDAPVGDNLMNVALRSGIKGIAGECGGNVSCGTCHVFVREEFVDLVGEPGEFEEDLLDMGVEGRRENSRLACQLFVSDELSGITVEIPPGLP